MSTNLNFVDNFDSIDEAQFSKLIRKNDAPFIQYSFLKALENSGCVGRDLGWTPKHLVKSNDTLKAINEPITAPIETPIKTITGFTTLMMVTATAMNMAEADKKLPLTAVSSLPSILIPLINNIDENM